jgi:serine/threonine-protein kinase CTR1
MDMGSLHDVLHGQSPLVLNWTVALQMLRDAARGIAYLHNLQPPVVHRDLKPANLLVNSSLTVKVADFGISRDVANHTMTAIGTAQWMAPEVIRNEAYTVSADTYAFGVIIWEVCCRRLPFGDCNPVQVILKVNAGERPPLPAQLPAVLSNLISNCWAEDPTARPSFSDIAEALAVLAPDATWPPYPQLKSI